MRTAPSIRIATACTLDAIQDFFVRVGHETTYAAIENHHFSTIPCHRQTYQNYEQRWQKLGTF